MNIVISTVSSRQPAGGLYWFDETSVDHLTEQAIIVNNVFEDIANEQGSNTFVDHHQLPWAGVPEVEWLKDSKEYVSNIADIAMNVEEKRSIMFNFIPPGYKTADN